MFYSPSFPLLRKINDWENTTFLAVYFHDPILLYFLTVSLQNNQDFFYFEVVHVFNLNLRHYFSGVIANQVPN